MVVLILVLALFATSAQASVLQLSDATTIHSLRKKLNTITVDVTQAMEGAMQTGNYNLFSCLSLIHDQGESVAMTAAGVGDLIALSLLMRDQFDEAKTLRALRTWLAVLSNDLPHARQIINGAMSLCSNSVIVNAKGQAFLNALSDWNEPVSSMARRVGQITR